MYMYHVLKHIDASLMLIWFPAVLLACGESVDESVHESVRFADIDNTILWLRSIYAYAIVYAKTEL